jgi:hypothetical protein
LTTEAQPDREIGGKVRRQTVFPPDRYKFSAPAAAGALNLYLRIMLAFFVDL